MSSMQEKVNKFNQQHKKILAKDARVLDLASEVGEVCKLAFTEKVGGSVAANQWSEELGDTLYSLLSLMSDLNIEAERALDDVLEKYALRLKNKARMDSGK